MDRFSQEAFEFVTGPAARQAFDIDKEDPQLRDRYGRHNWGQSTLLARRLVEAGSTFVTVHFGGWDHHWDLKAGYENYLPQVDSAVAGAVHRPGRARPAGHDAGGAVRRVQPHAEDERRRQRRRAAAAWARPAATTGATRCSASWAAAASRAARSSARPTASATRPHDAAADAVRTSTPRSTRCWASTRSCNCSTRAAGPVNVLDDPTPIERVAVMLVARFSESSRDHPVWLSWICRSGSESFENPTFSSTQSSGLAKPRPDLRFFESNRDQ